MSRSFLPRHVQFLQPDFRYRPYAPGIALLKKDNILLRNMLYIHETPDLARLFLANCAGMVDRGVMWPVASPEQCNTLEDHRTDNRDLFYNYAPLMSFSASFTNHLAHGLQAMLKLTGPSWHDKQRRVKDCLETCQRLGKVFLKSYDRQGVLGQNKVSAKLEFLPYDPQTYQVSHAKYQTGMYGGAIGFYAYVEPQVKGRSYNGTAYTDDHARLACAFTRQMNRRKILRVRQDTEEDCKLATWDRDEHIAGYVNIPAFKSKDYMWGLMAHELTHLALDRNAALYRQSPRHCLKHFGFTADDYALHVTGREFYTHINTHNRDTPDFERKLRDYRNHPEEVLAYQSGQRVALKYKAIL